MAIMPQDGSYDDGTYSENAGTDPWGADRTAAEDGAALARQAVLNGAKIRQLEAALGAEKRRRVQAEWNLKDRSGDEGELAIRRFLDDLAGVGLPATLYQAFSPDYREFIQTRLIFWAETANRMLGAFHDLPADAIRARDEKYAADDEAAEGITIKSGDPLRDPVPDKDAFTAWMEQAAGYQDEPDDDEDEQ